MGEIVQYDGAYEPTVTPPVDPMETLREMAKLRTELANKAYANAVKDGQLVAEAADLADRMITGLEKNAVHQLKIVIGQQAVNNDAELAFLLAQMVDHPAAAQFSPQLGAAQLPALPEPTEPVVMVPGEMTASEPEDYDIFIERAGKAQR